MQAQRRNEARPIASDLRHALSGPWREANPTEVRAPMNAAILRLSQQGSPVESPAPFPCIPFIHRHLLLGFDEPYLTEVIGQD
jgi:hypothetical protein